MPEITDTNFDQTLSAPVPGQSLTGTKGSMGSDRPPQYTDIEPAAEFTFRKLSNPKNRAKMVALLERGITAEAVTTTTLFTGITQGLWTLDLAMLMAPAVITQVAGLGASMGIEFEVFNPDTSLEDFFAQLQSGNTEVSEPAIKAFEESVITESEGIEGEGTQEEITEETQVAPEFQGFFSEGEV
jgi:hypothetical protein